VNSVDGVGGAIRRPLAFSRRFERQRVNVSAWTHVANRPSLLKYNSDYYRLRIGRLCPPLETREGAHHEIKSRFASSARHKRQK
jgi:hypothetical protein